MQFKYSEETDIVSTKYKPSVYLLILVNEYPTGRYLRDAKLWEIGAGTSEIRRIIVGRYFNQLFKK